MNDAIMYFLKVNIAIALFYLFYRLVFYNDTFWAARRFYLVFAILLSAMHPLISLSGWLEKQEPMQVIVANYVQLQEVTIGAKPATFWTIENILLAVYALVSLILLVRMCVQILTIVRWKMKGKKQVLHGIEIVSIDETITPFSFFKLIFMNPALHNEEQTSQILAHEKTHAQQRHSFDVLLSEIVTIICWINPAAWLLKREIRQNLEFLADNSVLESGFDSKSYQYHLLQLSYQTPEIKLGNKFNVSPLKKRITMMNQQKTKKAGIMKYSLIVPLALALVLSSNAQSIVNNAKEALSETKDVASVTKTTQVQNQKSTKRTIQFTPPVIKKDKSDTEKIYTVIEKMPVYPGGEKALVEYISQNLRYPADAHQNNIQGTVIIRFVVNKLGKVEKAEILRSLNPSTDAEGLKVINSLPDWIPGEQNGEKVAVYYTLPISFKMTDDSKAIPAAAYKKGVEASEIKVKGIDAENPPVFVVDGKIQSKDFHISSISPESIESVHVTKPDTEEKKAELISKYGENAANGVVEIAKKK